MHAWDPDQYLAYSDERARPFLDLLARVGAEAPRDVVDLGCGPGNLTALLARRWPGAQVRGVDSSPAMIARASGAPGLTFEVGDLREWSAPGGGVDVLVSNATLQWVPGHLELLPRLLAGVRPGGWFACQVPGNFAAPSHEIRRELAAEPAYAAFTTGVDVPASHDPEVYLAALRAEGCDADVWETTYLHVLTGDDAVFEWVSGTGALPTLQALPDGLRQEFESELRRRLRAAYPVLDGQVVLPFRRVFMVARVGSP